MDFLCESLTERGFEVTGLTSPREALLRIKTDSFDLVITDVEMPQMRGTELLAAILCEKPSQLVLLITAFGSIDLAVATVQSGACDFIAKPFKIEALLSAIERAFHNREIRREIVRVRKVSSLPASEQIVAKSPAMRKVLETAQKAAGADSTILITGETGTGKGVIARLIHDSSARRARPFYHLNCASLPPTLVESELFGVRRGAFTDAKADRAGAFVAAEDGTLFLDEVGELPLEIQAKLLHVLEQGLVRPLGSTAEVPIRARLIAATNRPIEAGLVLPAERHSHRGSALARAKRGCRCLDRFVPQPRLRTTIALFHRGICSGDATAGGAPLAWQRARAGERNRACGGAVRPRHACPRGL